MGGEVYEMPPEAHRFDYLAPAGGTVCEGYGSFRR